MYHPKILLVEDEPEIRKVIAQVLRVNKFEVYEAQDGIDAMYTLDQIQPDVVITDLAMPIMHGWAILDAVRKKPNFSTIPVIAITAFHSGQVNQNTNLAGFSAHFTKPIDFPALVTCIHELIAS